MSGDLVSLRIMVVSGSEPDRDLFRQGASGVAVPVDVVDAGNIGVACKMLASEIDIAFVDADIADAERAVFIAAARLARPAPFVIIFAPGPEDIGREEIRTTGIDGVVRKPTTPREAAAVVQRCSRLRLPTRVLVVDDSATMRNIVRKMLVGGRFRLDIFEAKEGLDALKQIANGKFDMVFLDYNMPGFNGLETLMEIKRQYPNLQVVIMTSAQDDKISDRARAGGAAAFLRKPFYPSDIDAVLHSLLGLRR